MARCAAFALFLLAGLTSAQENGGLRVDYSQIMADRLLWPPQVTLKSPATLILERDGLEAGMIELPAGRLVDVVALAPDGILIQFGSARGQVPPGDTDLFEQISSSTIARQVQTARLALIEEAAALIAPPEPSPSPSATPPDGKAPQAAPDSMRGRRPLMSPLEFATLSDDFDDPSTITQGWSDLSRAEGAYDHFSRAEIPRHEPGQLVITPRTSIWYQQYHGNLLFKEARGDFFVTTRLETTDKAGRRPPGSLQALAGLMLRVPAPDGPQNYVFFGTGTTDTPGTLQLIASSVLNSGDAETSLADTDLADGTSPLEIGLLRVGEAILCLYREPGAAWQLATHFQRPDFPVTLQAGVTASGDLLTAKQSPPDVHNSRGVRTGDPDLRARFDFVRFRPLLAALRELQNPEEIREILRPKD